MSQTSRCKPSDDVCLSHDEPLITAGRCQTGWCHLSLRVCYSIHACEICDQSIVFGQSYYDGGYGHRAHSSCVNK